MGFFFKNKKKNKEEETVTPVVETTPEVPAKEGMLLFNEIMYNNATDGAEYIEIYNPTEQAIILPVLYLYKMYKDGAIYNTTILQNESPSTPLTIPAKAYLCFTNMQTNRPYKS